MITDAVILAGGQATRLGSIARSTPKSMIKVAGVPFINYQLRLLKGAGINHVVICAGHLGEKIKDHLGSGSAFGLKVEYSFDGLKPLGTGGAVNKALSLLGDAFFVMYGDSYLCLDLADVSAYFTRQKKKAMMTVIENNNRWDKSNVLYANGLIKQYDKKNPSGKMRHIDYGLSVFSKEAFEAAGKGKVFDLSEIFEKLIRRGELAGYVAKERFFEIGSPAGLEEAGEYLEKKLTKGP